MRFSAMFLSLISLPAAAAPKEAQDWSLRMETPRRWVLDWALRDPNLVLMTSDQRGLQQLYMVDLKRERATQLTDEPAGTQDGSLSPDGRAALFVKDMLGNEIGQIFRVPAGGGKAEALMPEFPDKSVRAPRWGASGRTVYFDASDRTGFGAYQYALGAKRAFTVFFSTLEIYGAAPSADERYLAFSHDAGADGRSMDVCAVDLRSGAQAEMPPAPPGSSRSRGPWAREGNLARLLVSSDDSGNDRPGVWDVAQGSVAWLDTGVPGDVTAEDWFPGGRAILLLQRLDGGTALWKYDPDTSGEKASRLPVPQGRIEAPRARPDGAVWMRFESSELPPDYYSAAPSGELKPVLPDPPGAKPAPRSPRGLPAKSVEFKSADGAALQGWLAVPPAAISSPAAVILLHRGPADFAADSWDPARQSLAERGYVTLNLNYRGSIGFGKEFQNAVIGDPGRRELEDLAAARDWLIREQGVAASSVAVGGEGYGGYLALLAATTQPELWAAAYSIGGIADLEKMYEDASEPLRSWCRRMLGGGPEDAPDLYKDRSPIAHAFTLRAPVLMIHGRADSRAPLSQMEAFAARLKDAGKRHRLEVFEGGHAPLKAADRVRFLELILDFLRQSGLAGAGR